MLVSSIRDNFLSADFYTDNLSENDVYERIYDTGDGVLLDPEFEDNIQELLGDIDVPDEDIVEVARQIISPEYLQSQVEDAVTDIIDYLNKETDTPEVYLELGPPLERVKPALFGYIDGRIDELEDVPVTTIEELQQELERLFRTLEKGEIPTTLPSVEDPASLVSAYVDERIAELVEVPVTTEQEFKDELERVYRELTAGNIPTRIPSIDPIPPSLRSSTYDLVLMAIQNDPSIPEEVKAGLERQDEAIKTQLLAGNTKGALETASRELTGPAVEEFVDDAYDRAFRSLQEDKTFPQAALEGLDEHRDAIKEDLGAGRIRDALKLGARGLAAPLIDEALAELREDLVDGDRLDLVAKAAEQDKKTKAEFLDDYDIIRDIIDRGEVGYWLAILIIVLALLFMAFVHIPHLSSSLRWPGLTLLLSGLVFLILGLVTRSALFQNPLNRADVDPIPPTMVDIINDVASSMAADVGSGFITFSVIIMVIGVALLVGSFFIRLLHIPFISR